MLSAKHDGRSVTHPMPLLETPSAPGDVLAELRVLRESDTNEPFSSVSREEYFARRHMHVRDELAWRAAKGERLSNTEKATLLALDAVLDSLEPPSAPLPPEVQDLMRLARR